jgi:hypothetical protein
MQNHSLVPKDILRRYDVREWRNGLAILHTVRPREWADILSVLRGFKLLRSDMAKPGGRKSEIANKLDQHFTRLGWCEKQFHTRIFVDDAEYHSPTHKVDCYKNRVALEVEWANKDTFFDRDLNNFRLLFELRAIDVGVILTRSRELGALRKTARGKSFVASTTSFEKLVPRLEGGGGGGCPVVAIAIKTGTYVDDGPD